MAEQLQDSRCSRSMDVDDAAPLSADSRVFVCNTTTTTDGPPHHDHFQNSKKKWYHATIGATSDFSSHDNNITTITVNNTF